MVKNLSFPAAAGVKSGSGGGMILIILIIIGVAFLLYFFNEDVKNKIDSLLGIPGTDATSNDAKSTQSVGSQNNLKSAQVQQSSQSGNQVQQDGRPGSQGSFTNMLDNGSGVTLMLFNPAPFTVDQGNWVRIMDGPYAGVYEVASKTADSYIVGVPNAKLIFLGTPFKGDAAGTFILVR